MAEEASQVVSENGSSVAPLRSMIVPAMPAAPGASGSLSLVVPTLNERENTAGQILAAVRLVNLDPPPDTPALTR